MTQPSTATIVVLDQHGSYITEIGRAGDGPGEFRRISHVASDETGTLWVTDAALGRITSVDSARTTVRTWRVAAVVETPGISPRMVAAIDSSWAIVEHVTEAYAAHDGLVERLPLTAVRVADGESHVLDMRPTKGTILAIRNDGQQRRGVFAPHPFSPTPMWAVSASDRSVVIADRFTTSDDGFESVTLRKVFVDGTTQWQRQIEVPAQPIPDATRDSLREFWTGVAMRANSVRVGGEQAARELVEDALAFPPAGPAVDAMIVGRDGRIWLKKGSPPLASESEWLVFDRNGLGAGSVRLPRGLQVMSSSKQRIIGVEYDDLGVPYLASYRIDEPSTRVEGTRR